MFFAELFKDLGCIVITSIVDDDDLSGDLMEIKVLDDGADRPFYPAFLIIGGYYDGDKFTGFHPSSLGKVERLMVKAVVRPINEAIETR